MMDDFRRHIIACRHVIPAVPIMGSINMVMAVTEKKAAKIREPVEQIVIG